MFDGIRQPHETSDKKEAPSVRRDALGALGAVYGVGLRHLEQRRGDHKKIDHVVKRFFLFLFGQMPHTVVLNHKCIVAERMDCGLDNPSFLCGGRAGLTRPYPQTILSEDIDNNLNNIVIRVIDI